MRVDFYQLSRDPVEHVLPQIAARVLEEGERLLVVAAAPEQRDRISRGLWDAGPATFLAHDLAEGDAPEVQPILLSADCAPVNGATRIALADGAFRDDALGFVRTFYFFDPDTIDAARSCWRTLSKRDDVETHFWRQDGGKWRKGP